MRWHNLGKNSIYLLQTKFTIIYLLQTKFTLSGQDKCMVWIFLIKAGSYALTTLTYVTIQTACKANIAIDIFRTVNRLTILY